jgi:hypothetical protein
MDVLPIGIVASGFDADVLAGLAIGGAIGYLAGPILRHRLAYREWRDASREARLADELLTKLEELDDAEDANRPGRRVETGQPMRWPASR